MAKEKYGIVETSKIRASYMGGGHIYSVVDEDNDMEQGSIVVLGEPYTKHGLEEYTVKTPTDKDGVILIADVALMYDQSSTEAQQEYYYVNVAGKSTRAYQLQAHDMFAVSSDMITALDEEKGVVDGNYVVASGRKYTEVAKGSSMPTAGFVARIRYTTVKGFTENAVKMIMLEVLHNAE